MTDDVVHDLTVPDGPCRDINLFGVTGPRAERLLTWITSQFDSHIGEAYPSSEEFEPIEAANFAAPMNAGYSVHGFWERGSKLFGRLQYYLVPQQDGEWFVELTFFPEDIHLDDSVTPLVNWLKKMLNVASAYGVIVRFENASFEPTWDRRDDPEVIISLGPETYSPIMER